MKERTLFLVTFLAITALTSIVVLGANIGKFGEDLKDSRFSQWGLGVVLAEIIGATTLAYRSLYALPDLNVDLTFEKPKSPLPLPDTYDLIPLDLENCTYTIKEMADKVGSGKMSLTSHEIIGEINGKKEVMKIWRCKLPKSLKPDQNIEFQLKDKKGVEWEITPFVPFELKSHEARMK
jgi:hypothetical protein